MVLELARARSQQDLRFRRRCHQPEGPVGVGLDVARGRQRPKCDLAHSQGDRDSAEPAAADDLPPILKGFGAAPPLVTDINLSLEDRFLYVSCFGTGELKQFDVSDPFSPIETGSVKLGGMVRRQPHPARPARR